MAATFYVGSEAGIKKLNEYLLTRSYITGYQASKDDIIIRAAFAMPPSADYMNVSRWYNHIEALLRISNLKNNQLTGPITSTLTQIPNLKTFYVYLCSYLARNQLTDEIPRYLPLCCKS